MFSFLLLLVPMKHLESMHRRSKKRRHEERTNDDDDDDDDDARILHHFVAFDSSPANASFGMSTLPMRRMRFFPLFCFSSSFFFREMSPP